MNWKNVGGIPGVVLTLANVNEECKTDSHVTITSPIGVKQMINILKESNIVKKLLISIEELDKIKEYDDNVLTISCIPIYPNVDNKYEHMVKTIIDNDTSHSNKKRKNNEIRTEKRMKSSDNIIPVLSYICTLKDKPGTLSLEKCLAKGLKPGPLLGLIKNGTSITLDDGTIVKQEEVCSPNEKGSIFLGNHNFSSSSALFYLSLKYLIIFLI